MSYYKTIDGQKYDGKLLSLAEEAIQGAGDGRISVKDAEGLFGAVRDGGVYTDVEKETVAYIRNKFRWTPSAAEWFGSRVTSLNYLHFLDFVSTFVDYAFNRVIFIEINKLKFNRFA